MNRIPTNTLFWLVASHHELGIDLNTKSTMMAALIRIGADVHAEFAGDGETVLHYAAANQDLDMIKILLSLPGIDVNFIDDRGWTPIATASANENDEAIDLLLAAGAEITAFANKTEDEFEMDHFCGPYINQRKAQEANFDWYRMLDFIVSVPALASIRSPASGGPSLQKLCFQSIHSNLLKGDYDAESVANVLAAVADTNLVKPLVYRLALAVVLGYYGLPQRPGQLDPIIRSTLESLGLLDNYSTIKNQLEASKNNVNRYLKNGMTLITQAARAGNIELIGLLLSRFGAKLHWPDQHGNTAILAAAKGGQPPWHPPTLLRYSTAQTRC